MQNAFFYGFAIDEYPLGRKLGSAVRDVDVLGETLRSKFGFEKFVRRNRDVTRDSINSAFQTMVERHSPADIVIVMFSGHGSSECWEVSARAGSGTVYYPVSEILGNIHRLDVRHLLLISDSCHALGQVRKNKNADGPLLQADEALWKQLENQPSRMFFAGTGLGYAYDGGVGLSPFVGAIVTMLQRTPGPVNLGLLAEAVRRQCVASQQRHQRFEKQGQIPHLRHLDPGLDGELVFRPLPAPSWLEDVPSGSSSTTESITVANDDFDSTIAVDDPNGWAGEDEVESPIPPGGQIGRWIGQIGRWIREWAQDPHSDALESLRYAFDELNLWLDGRFGALRAADTLLDCIDVYEILHALPRRAVQQLLQEAHRAARISGSHEELVQRLAQFGEVEGANSPTLHKVVDALCGVCDKERLLDVRSNAGLPRNRPWSKPLLARDLVLMLCAKSDANLSVVFTKSAEMVELAKRLNLPAGLRSKNLSTTLLQAFRTATLVADLSPILSRLPLDQLRRLGEELDGNWESDAETTDEVVDELLSFFGIANVLNELSEYDDWYDGAFSFLLWGARMLEARGENLSLFDALCTAHPGVDTDAFQLTAEHAEVALVAALKKVSLLEIAGPDGLGDEDVRPTMTKAEIAAELVQNGADNLLSEMAEDERVAFARKLGIPVEWIDEDGEQLYDDLCGIVEGW